MSTIKNYETIDQPYNNFLERSDKDASYSLVEDVQQDKWLTSELKSRNYQPQSQGFYFDGKTGETNFGNVNTTKLTLGGVEYATINTQYEGNNEIDVVLKEDLSAGALIKVLLESGTVKAQSIATSQSGSAGSPVVFYNNAVGSDNVPIVYDTNIQRAVIVYPDISNYGYGIVGTVSEDSISFGDPVIISSSPNLRINPGANYLQMTFDSNTNRIAFYYYTASGGKVVFIGIVSGSTISWGAINSPITVSAVQKIIFHDSGNKMVIIGSFVSTGYGMQICVGTLSGITISWGSVAYFIGYNLGYGLPAGIVDTDTNKIVMVSEFFDGGIRQYRAAVGTVSGTIISWGTPAQMAVTPFSSDQLQGPIANKDIIGMAFDASTGKVLAVYRDTGDSDFLKCQVGTINGTDISFGSAVTINADDTDYFDVLYFPPKQQIAVVYNDSGNANYGTIVMGTISGTTISFDTPFVFRESAIKDVRLAYDVFSGKLIVSFKDSGNSDKGTAVVVDMADTITYTSFHGVLQETGTAGQTKKAVLPGGISDVHSGLTTGSTYYLQNTGTIGLTETNYPAGKAISTTQLLLFNTNIDPETNYDGSIDGGNSATTY